MIPLTVHYRGLGSEQRRLAAVPAVGTYLFGPGDCRRLWVADAVVVDTVVAVYCIEVSPRLAGELTAAWAAWGEPIAPALPDAAMESKLRSGLAGA